MARCLLAFLLATGEDSGDLPQLLPGTPSLLTARIHTRFSATSVTLLTAPYFPASASISWYCNSTRDLLNMLPLPINPSGSTSTTRCSYWELLLALVVGIIVPWTEFWHLSVLAIHLLIIVSLTVKAHVSCLLCLQDHCSWACSACWLNPDPHFPLLGDIQIVSTVCRWSN